MKKFLVKSLLIIPCFLAIFGINYFVDPGMLLTRQSRFDKIVQIMASGKNVGMVAMPSKTTFVPLKKAAIDRIFENGKRKIDIVVLGSSRSSEIQASFFPGKTFFNFSVGRPHLADYIDIFTYLKLKNMKPDIAIIGIDPWFGEFINSDSSEYFYNTLFPSFTVPYRSDKVFYFNEKLNLLKDFFSLPYTQSSFSGIVGLFRAHRFSPLFATEQDCGTGLYILRADGSYSLECASTLDDEKVRAVSVAYANNKKGNFFGEKWVSDQKFTTLFEAFIKLLRAENITPVLFFSPVNADAFNILISGENNNVEEYFKSIAKLNHISIIGSFNPANCKFTQRDKLFIDQYHPSSIAIEKIFNKFDVDRICNE